MLDNNRESVKNVIFKVYEELGYTYNGIEEEKEILKQNFYDTFDSMDLLEFIIEIEDKLDIILDDSIINGKIEEIIIFDDFIDWVFKNNYE